MLNKTDIEGKNKLIVIRSSKVNCRAAWRNSRQFCSSDTFHSYLIQMPELNGMLKSLLFKFKYFSFCSELLNEYSHFCCLIWAA